MAYLYIGSYSDTIKQHYMSKQAKNKKESSKEEDLPGNPRYPDSEDIYSKDEKDEDIDIDGDLDAKPRKKNKKSPGDDLDVPGSELDDADEEIGEEDEENNYYSLGGDDHDDLEEDKGE